MDIRLAAAIEHRTAKRYAEAHAILSELVSEFPDDPSVHYHLAWLYDKMENEQAAIPHYEKAIASGLSGEDLRGALLGLGSTYRCLGNYTQAVITLRRGMAQFPDAGEFPVFLAMALHNVGDHAEAMRLLLHTVATRTNDTGIEGYKPAILFYHDQLGRVW